MRRALCAAALACVAGLADAQQPDRMVVPAVRGDSAAGTLTLRYLRFPATM